MSDALERARNSLPAIDNALRYAAGSDFDGAEQEYDALKAARLALAALLAEHEALLRRVDRMESVGKLIVDGAIPATTSGHTCFVPRYQIDQLKAALDVRILAEPGEVGCG